MKEVKKQCKPQSTSCVFLISTLVFIITAVVFAFGQLLRINISDISFPVIDICIFLIFITNIFIHLSKKQLVSKNKYLLFFIIFAWVSLGINYYRYSIDSVSPFLYLCRLTFLLSFFVFPLNITNSTRNFFLISLITCVVFGLIQYLIWPDFTYFNSLNWDPHLHRLVGSFFDPTFTAFIYLVFLIYLFLNPKFLLRIPLMVITYIALALTYSRSTYLSFLIAFLFISIRKKNVKIFLFSFLLFLATIFSLPRQPGEGTKLERTSSILAKIENYKEGFKVFSNSPLIGHGYNNLFYARTINNTNSHANNGFDSSLITILTTTGIIGLILFLFGLKTNFVKSNLTRQTIFVALLIHSLFANSLLYPWILLLLVII